MQCEWWEKERKILAEQWAGNEQMTALNVVDI